MGDSFDWVSRGILSTSSLFWTFACFWFDSNACSLVAAVSKPDYEKNSAYECGFEPFESARIKFDVRFYLVAILFVIFDLEVAFLFLGPLGSNI